MRSGWLMVLCVVCMIELILLGAWFVRDRRGLAAFREIQEREVMLNKTAGQLSGEIERLTQTIDDWKKYPFYREAWAREHINVAYSDEDIYVIRGEDKK